MDNHDRLLKDFCRQKAKAEILIVIRLIVNSRDVYYFSFYNNGNCTEYIFVQFREKLTPFYHCNLEKRKRLVYNIDV